MRLATRVLAGIGVLFLSIATPFVTHWEEFRPEPYKDAVGIPTVCYGDTQIEMRIYTKEECDKHLREKLEGIGKFIDRKVSVPLTPSRKAALVSFVYNVGEPKFLTSTLLKKLNRGDVIGACNELPKWIYAKGKKLRGLERRRAAERELCLKGTP